jgi:hypothetical protein
MRPEILSTKKSTESHFPEGVFCYDSHASTDPKTPARGLAHNVPTRASKIVDFNQPIPPDSTLAHQALRLVSFPTLL